MKPAEHYRRRDIDPTARLDPLAQIHCFELVMGCQQSPAVFEITRAGIGQRDRAGRPIEKAGLQTLLERRDPPGDGSRRAAQLPRGLRKALLLCYGDEDRQGIEPVLHTVALTEIEKRVFRSLQLSTAIPTFRLGQQGQRDGYPLSHGPCSDTSSGIRRGLASITGRQRVTASKYSTAKPGAPTLRPCFCCTASRAPAMHPHRGGYGSIF